MFKLDPSPTFKIKVKIPVPGDKSAALEVEFRHKTKKELQRYLEEAAGGRDDVQALDEIIVGWSGLEEAYSKDVLARLLDNYPGSAGAILGTYAKELGDARLGN